MSSYKLPATSYKLLVLVGPTASGKSELAVRLAKQFNGEVVSADSRQIYKGMDIGTGKIPGRWRDGKFVYKGITHHLIDFINPNRRFSVALYQTKANQAVADIIKRGKLPIICGGTAHWIDALVYNQQIPDVKPNLKLRLRLEKKSAADLFQQLKNLDPNRAKSIDSHNKRRLIRALEIVITTGKPVPPIGVILSGAKDLKKRDSSASGLRMTPDKTLWLGLNPGQKNLYKNIDRRLRQRLKAGMVKEVARLHSGSLPLFSKEGAGGSSKKRGLSWKKLESFGLEYKYVSLYLQKKLTYQEMVDQLSFAIKHYSKRQMTWWKRNKEIKWLN